ncbi:MAG TPA: GNAT family N-acetyltransferase [Thermoanaerobaculia bacterium]
MSNIELLEQSLSNLSRYESDVVLRNGLTLHLRPIRPDDDAAILTLFKNLSAESLYKRFIGFRDPVVGLAASPTRVDYQTQFGVVAETAHVVGVAHYFRDLKHPEKAEVAFTISDEMQHCGIGTHLLEKLAVIGRDRGLTTFEAEVLADNRAMMDVFIGSGFVVKGHLESGMIHVDLSLEPTADHEERAAQRAGEAASASMRAIFAPRSIAIVGASRRRGQLGGELFRNLIAGDFRGAIYPVNSKGEPIDCYPVHRSLREIEGEIELAVIVVPAAQVESVIDDCIAKRVRAVVVISAGFGEVGGEGRERERRLLDKIRSAGMRMVGPNCMGVINTDPAVQMHASFAQVHPPRGNVAMSTQSGALGLAILDYARQINIGFSTFMSVGNKADVSGNDLIQYWAEDPNTDVILLYLESFGNPVRFSRIARRVARKKPIIAVKSGRSKSGARAATSHTGALAVSDAIVDDLFRQAGIIRTDTLEQMFDVASLLARQPLPKGSRVAIVTNAGGPGILAADACEANGLSLATLSQATVERLRSFLPAAASVANPVDMIASASPDHYRETIEAVLGDDGVDALVVIYIPVLPDDADAVARAIGEGAKSANEKTMITTFMGAARGAPLPLSSIPSFPFPERAVNALARATEYAAWKKKPAGKIVRFDDIDRDVVREIVGQSLRDGEGWMRADRATALLAAAGIRSAETRFAATLDEAEAAAVGIGFPVALKATGATILHKSDVGGVKLSLEDCEAVRAAYQDFEARLGPSMSGVIVQQMISGGVELMVGAVRQPTFGHVLVYGAGGTLVELLSDVSFAIHPISDVDAADMLDEVQATKLLRGHRGSVGDESAVREILMRLSHLAELAPEIAELDINPLRVLEKGAIGLDVRLRLEPLPIEAPSRRIAY